MSYDLEIYTFNEPDLSILEKVGFTFEHSNAIYRRENWQIVVNTPCIVDKEDIYAEVQKYMQSIKYLIAINLEGVSTDKSLSVLKMAAYQLADTFEGIILNQQDCTIGTSSSTYPMSSLSSPLKVDEIDIRMCWWFEDIKTFTKTGYAQFYEVLEKDIPKSLPHRYGDYEPPQYKLKDTSKTHFLNFWKDKNFQIVWYPKKPLIDIECSVPSEVGPTSRGYRCGFINIVFNRSLIEQEKDCANILQTWLAISNLLKPFYAEIRKGETPVKNWWWNGIPKKLGCATLIGPPYTSLWKEFCQVSQKTTIEQYYSENLTLKTLSPIACSVPNTIGQPPDEEKVYDKQTGKLIHVYKYNKIQYPEIWPFQEPFRYA